MIRTPDTRTGQTARYLEVDYRQLCQQLLGHHPRPGSAVAELCLFHLWLACRTASGLPPHPHRRLPIPAGWPLPLQAGGHWLEEELGGTLARLLETRFPLYDRFLAVGRHEQDPLGLRAATVALACQLYTEPPAEVIERLQAHTDAVFIQLSAG